MHEVVEEIIYNAIRSFNTLRHLVIQLFDRLLLGFVKEELVSEVVDVLVLHELRHIGGHHLC